MSATVHTATKATKGQVQPEVKHQVLSGMLQPTNFDMLVFRTLNRDLRLPTANDDYLAEKLRDELVPFRSWCMKHVLFCKQQMKRTCEHPVWGIPGCVNFVDVRTSWLDSAVKAAIQDGVTQVVLIAAGFDTRAYRLHAPGVTFFEVDLPHASARKQQLVDKLQLLPPQAEAPMYVGADLAKVPLAVALQPTGFQPAKPTLFTIEGLIYYLPAPAVDALFESISHLTAPGSRVFFDFLAQSAVTNTTTFAGIKMMKKMVAKKGEPLLSGIPADHEAVGAFATRHGFTLRRYLSPKAMAALMLPGAKWSERKPPICSFFNFAEMEKTAEDKPC